jgi:hypothetical protein
MPAHTPPVIVGKRFPGSQQKPYQQKKREIGGFSALDA